MKRFLRHTFLLTALFTNVVLECACLSYDESPVFIYHVVNRGDRREPIFRDN